MEEILEDFRKSQLHFRRVALISVLVIISFGLVTFYYLEGVKYNGSYKSKTIINTTNTNNNFIVAEFVSTTTDSISFRPEYEPFEKNHSAYLDNKTVNNLSGNIKKGDMIKIYSKNPVTEDDNSFVVVKMENAK